MSAATLFAAPPVLRFNETTPDIPLAQDWLNRQLPGARVIREHENWWDGAARVACLTVDLHGRRYRLVPAGGRVLVLPPSARQARRELAAWRDGRTRLPAVPAEVQVAAPPAPLAAPSAERGAH